MGGRLTTDLRGAHGLFGGTFDPIHLAHLAVAEGLTPTDADLPVRRARFVRKVLESEVGRRG